MAVGLSIAATAYAEILKPQIYNAAYNAMKNTFINQYDISNGVDIGHNIADNFAMTLSENLAGLICDAIANIVGQANITGNSPLMGTCAVGPTTTIVAPGQLMII